MNRQPFLMLLSLVIANGFAATVFGQVAPAREHRSPEPWADPSNPVVDGLHVWLDASRLQPARAALGLAPLKEGEGVDNWPDASGNKRHQRQSDSASQPT